MTNWRKRIIYAFLFLCLLLSFAFAVDDSEELSTAVIYQEVF